MILGKEMNLSGETKPTRVDKYYREKFSCVG
jgi:hypothetical protein